MRQFSQRGFALFELVLIAGVVAIVGLVGWNLYQNRQKDGSPQKAPSSQTVQIVPNAPAVSSVADLDEASKILEQTQIDASSETADLDKELASF